MRAVFTVQIPRRPDGTFFTDTEIKEAIETFGWRPSKGTIEDRDQPQEKNNETQQVHRVIIPTTIEKARLLFDEMPEVAAAERAHLLDWGYLADDQTAFVVTRLQNAQITFRLVQTALPRLQRATVHILKHVLAVRFDLTVHPENRTIGYFDKFSRATRTLVARLLPSLCTAMRIAVFPVSNRQVLIYERDHDNVIIDGRVVPVPFRETLRTDRRDLVFIVASFALAAFILAALEVGDQAWLQAHATIKGTLERSSTVFITTTVVSMIGFLNVWWDISRNHLVAWSVNSSNLRDK